jgi:hypothetical protein
MNIFCFSALGGQDEAERWMSVTKTETTATSKPESMWDRFESMTVVGSEVNNIGGKQVNVGPPCQCPIFRG